MANKQTERIERNWKSSSVNLKQVNQNTKNAKRFVKLTEQYKEASFSLHGKLNTIFDDLKSYSFAKYDPETPLLQDFETFEGKRAVVDTIKLFLDDEAYTKATKPESVELASLLSFHGKDLVRCNLLGKERVESTLEAVKSKWNARDVEQLESWLKKVTIYPSMNELNKHFSFPADNEDLSSNSLVSTLSDYYTPNEQQSTMSPKTAMVLCVGSGTIGFLVSYSSRLFITFFIFPASYLLGLFGGVSAIRSSENNQRISKLINISDDCKENFYPKYLSYQDNRKKITDEETLKYIENMDFLKLHIQNHPDLDVEAVKKWMAYVEAKQAFLKHTLEMHETYETILNIDYREEKEDNATDSQPKPDTKAKATSKFDVIKEYFGKFTGWFSGYDKMADKTTAKAEESAEDCILFGLWCSTKVTKKEQTKLSQAASADDAENNTGKTEGNAQNNTQEKGKELTLVRKVNAESVESLDQIHDKYQTMTAVLVDLVKGACYSEALSLAKLAASCLIRKPYETVTETDKLDCEPYAQAALYAREQCDFIFPFSANSDDIITKYLDGVSKVEVEIYENGEVGLTTHTDKVSSDLGQALRTAIYNSYLALPADSNQQRLNEALEISNKITGDSLAILIGVKAGELIAEN